MENRRGPHDLRPLRTDGWGGRRLGRGSARMRARGCGVRDGAEVSMLAKRVEQASGPDRALADAALLACGWTQQFLFEWSEPAWWSPGGGSMSRWSLPDPTDSLDAALTLVPQGHRFRLWHHHTGKFGADVFPDGGGTVSRSTNATTPALALCAAAVRANAHAAQAASPPPHPPAAPLSE
jgi:hypothetical protein